VRMNPRAIHEAVGTRRKSVVKKAHPHRKEQK